MIRKDIDDIIASEALQGFKVSFINISPFDFAELSPNNEMGNIRYVVRKPLSVDGSLIEVYIKIDMRLPLGEYICGGYQWIYG